MTHLLIVGGSDAGISAALRAREVDSTVEVTVVAADAFPNYSICGLPFYLSGEVSEWQDSGTRYGGRDRAWGSVQRPAQAWMAEKALVASWGQGSGKLNLESHAKGKRRAFQRHIQYICIK